MIRPLLTTMGVIALTSCAAPQSWKQDFKVSPEQDSATHIDSDANLHSLNVIVPKLNRYSLLDAVNLNVDYIVPSDIHGRYKKYLYSYKEGQSQNFTFKEEKCSYEPSIRYLLDGQYIDANTRCIESHKFPFPPSGHVSTVTGIVNKSQGPEKISYNYSGLSAKSDHDVVYNVWSDYLISDYKEPGSIETFYDRFRRYKDQIIQVKTNYGVNSVKSTFSNNSNAPTKAEIDYVNKVDLKSDGEVFHLPRIYLPLEDKKGLVTLAISSDKYKSGTVIYIHPTYYLSIDANKKVETLDYSSARKQTENFIREVFKDLQG